MKNTGKKMKYPVEDRRHEQGDMHESPFQRAALEGTGRRYNREMTQQNKNNPMLGAMERAAKSDHVKNKYIQDQVYTKEFREIVNREPKKRDRVTKADAKKAKGLRSRTGIR